MSGFLAVFDEHEEEKARNSTYELLQPKNKISIGKLSRIKNKKIVIDVEVYGAIGDISEFSLQKMNAQTQSKQLSPTHSVYPLSKPLEMNLEKEKQEIKKIAQRRRKTKKKYKLFL